VLQPQRDHRFLDLALEGPLGRQEHQLGELLRDRAAALAYLAGDQVDDGRAGHADRVEAEMVVEAMVLDRDRGLRQIPRNLVQVQDVAAEPAAHREDLAVRRDQRGRDLELLALEIVGKRQRIGEIAEQRHHHDSDDDGDVEGDAQEAEHGRGRAGGAARRPEAGQRSAQGTNPVLQPRHRWLASISWS